MCLFYTKRIHLYKANTFLILYFCCILLKTIVSCLRGTRIMNFLGFIEIVQSCFLHWFSALKSSKSFVSPLLTWRLKKRVSTINNRQSRLVLIRLSLFSETPQKPPKHIFSQSDKVQDAEYLSVKVLHSCWSLTGSALCLSFS